MSSVFCWDEQFHLARKAENLRRRASLISDIRNFFNRRDFLEIETPVWIPSPAPEEYIEAISAKNWFLQTSPELCMKRLLAAGYPRIFQFCKCFRDNERGARHLPEFTMLEWYVAGFDYHDLMRQCELLLCETLSANSTIQAIAVGNRTIRLTPPWEKITVADAFLRFAPIDCAHALKEDKFEEILVEYIEPCLGFEIPVFLYDYPAELASLSKIKKSDQTVAERFELYIGGVEIANGFSELTDADEQRRRFEAATQARSEKYWTSFVMPEKFLLALKNMPESAGIALGFDRLAMLLTGADKIDDVIAFPPEWL